MKTPRSFLGHLVALRSDLEVMGEYFRAHGDTFVLNASNETMAKAGRTSREFRGSYRLWTAS